MMPIMDTVRQGRYLRMAVWMKRLWPKLATLAFMVYSMPVAPVYGKYAHKAVRTRKSH